MSASMTRALETVSSKLDRSSSKRSTGFTVLSWPGAIVGEMRPSGFIVLFSLFRAEFNCSFSSCRSLSELFVGNSFSSIPEPYCSMPEVPAINLRWQCLFRPRAVERHHDPPQWRPTLPLLCDGSFHQKKKKITSLPGWIGSPASIDRRLLSALRAETSDRCHFSIYHNMTRKIQDLLLGDHGKKLNPLLFKDQDLFNHFRQIFFDLRLECLSLFTVLFGGFRTTSVCTILVSFLHIPYITEQYLS